MNVPTPMANHEPTYVLVPDAANAVYAAAVAACITTGATPATAQHVAQLAVQAIHALKFWQLPRINVSCTEHGDWAESKHTQSPATTAATPTVAPQSPFFCRSHALARLLVPTVI